MHNESKGHRQEFPETRWSIVVNASDLESPARNHALESLIESYLPVLRAHLILRRRLNPDLVEDFIQDFFLKKILQQNVVSRADSQRGKFRSFLLKSLENFVRDYFRTNKMQEQLDEFAMESEAGPKSDGDSNAPNVFETAWARQVFCNAIEQFKKECDIQGHESRWLLFRERLLIPVVAGEDAEDYVDLAEKCKFASAKQARNAMVSIKRSFERAMKSVIKDYVLDEDQVDSELHDLFRILNDSDILDEVLGDFVPLQSSLQLDNSCFQSIQLNAFLDMDQNTTKLTDRQLSKTWLAILDSSFETIRLGSELRQIAPSLEPDTVTIADALFSPTPSLKVLDLIRTYGKAEFSSAGGSLEESPCYFVLYITAIAAAVYKHQKPLSRLPVDQLKSNFEWALEFPWLDAETHEYLQIAKRVV
jgi:RNA polymerase sigma-70 factor (ECF subfamily)